MKCTCCLCPWQEMGEGAISQSSPSEALRMFCQSRFLVSFFFCTSLLENLRHMPPSPSSCLDCPSVLAIAAVWLWRSSVGLVGLVALVSHVPPRHQRRSRPVGARLSSGLKIFTWFSVPFLFVFSLFVRGSLEDLSLPQFSSRTSVWWQNSLLIQSLLHFDCFLFRALPFSQNSFLSSDF